MKKFTSNSTAEPIPPDKQGWSTFSVAEIHQWHAYKYAWRKIYFKNDDHWYAGDPRGEYYNEKLISAVFGCYFYKDERGELTIPYADYQLPPRIDRKKAWRYRIAAAYRWEHEKGNTIPAGHHDKSPFVIDLVERTEHERKAAATSADAARAPYLKAFAEGAAWLDEDRQPTPLALEFAALCKQQSAMFIDRWVARNREAFGLPPHTTQSLRREQKIREESLAKARRESETISYDTFLGDLGVRATERKNP